MAEYINKTDLLADILDEECRSEKADSINALFWFARLVQRQPVADVIPRNEVEKAKQNVAREILNTFSSFRALSPNFCKVYYEFEKKYIGEEK